MVAKDNHPRLRLRVGNCLDLHWGPLRITSTWDVGTTCYGVSVQKSPNTPSTSLYKRVHGTKRLTSSSRLVRGLRMKIVAITALLLAVGRFFNQSNNFILVSKSYSRARAPTNRGDLTLVMHALPVCSSSYASAHFDANFIQCHVSPIRWSGSWRKLPKPVLPADMSTYPGSTCITSTTECAPAGTNDVKSHFIRVQAPLK